MTVTLESYTDANGIHADIDQDKYSTTYRLEIFEVYDTCLANTLFRNDGYRNIESARKAMRRILSTPIEKTYDHRKGE